MAHFFLPKHPHNNFASRYYRLKFNEKKMTNLKKIVVVDYGTLNGHDSL